MSLANGYFLIDALRDFYGATVVPTFIRNEFDTKDVTVGLLRQRKQNLANVEANLAKCHPDLFPGMTEFVKQQAGAGHDDFDYAPAHVNALADVQGVKGGIETVLADAAYASVEDKTSEVKIAPKDVAFLKDAIAVVDG